MGDAIPSFFVYGEPDRRIDLGLIHVETVMARRGLHQGQVRAHTHRQMGQITFWTAGSGQYFLDDRILDFCAPAISFVPSRVVHGFNVSPGSDAIVVSIADGALTEIAPLARLPLDTPVMLVASGQQACWRRIARLMAIIEESYSSSHDGERGSDRVIYALAAAVLGEVRRLSQAMRSQPRAQPDGPAPLAARLRSLVDRHFRDDWPVARYAAELRTTPYLLGQACRKAFGLTVKRLIIERRLLEAKRLLLFTIRTLDDIAGEVGVNDPAYFSRLFRNRTGLAPTDWRQQQTGRLQTPRRQEAGQEARAAAPRRPSPATTVSLSHGGRQDRGGRC
ncbi:MAG TPA: helix-turn-helix domain-containing protein [Hyphomicrobiaceae bacterium]|nr:helix-turn-helix domain-containing protein [Hyphomicrobiaceae bacterium]